MHKQWTKNDYDSFIEHNTNTISSETLTTEPKVSVCLITYQQKKSIEKALISILEQKTSFEFEIIISDDGSNDGSYQLLLNYQKQHPEKIKLVRTLNRDPNIHPHTGKFNALRALELSNAPYIATLEGDDYWTSPHKLQKQFEVLEKNQTANICFHNTNIEWLFTPRYRSRKILIEKPHQNPIPFIDCVKSNYIAQASCYFFRNDIQFLYDPFFLKNYPLDVPIILGLTCTGKHAYYIDETLSTWVRSQNTASSRISKDAKAAVILHIEALSTLERHFNVDLMEAKKIKLRNHNKCIKTEDAIKIILSRIKAKLLFITYRTCRFIKNPFT